MCVAVPRCVEPDPGHLFPILGRCKYTIQQPLVGTCAAIRQERVDLSDRRWQPGQIKRHSPNQGTPIRFHFWL